MEWLDVFMFRNEQRALDGRGAVFAGRGQAVVEGAFLIPVLLLLLMLLIQPGILLYNYVVMKGAAAEGCRLIATSGAGQTGTGSFEASIKRHLGAVPQQENFHVHASGCTWHIELEGNEQSDQVNVTIKNEVEPLPLFDFGAQALGITNAAGNFVQEVTVTRAVYSSWVYASEDGLDPDGWVHRDDSLLEGRE